MRAVPWLMAAAVVIWSPPGLADVERTFDYRYDSVWSGSIRLIRADKGYPIKDKDRENGFILFVYPGTGSVKECLGSLQIIRMTDERGFRKVRTKLTIAHQPSYLEVQLLDGLEQKLREEYGRPPPPERDPGKGGPPKEQPPRDQPPKDQPPREQPPSSK